MAEVKFKIPANILFIEIKYLTVLMLSIISALPLCAQWTQKSDIPGVKRHHPVTFSIDGKGYYLAGMGSGNVFYDDFYEYDPQNDTWTKKADFPGGARGFAYGTAINGKGYIGFGSNQFNYFNDLWEYDPISDQWTQKASMTGFGRRHPAFVAFDGKIFVGLGDGQPGNFRDWHYYTIATDTWTKGPDLPAIARHHPYYFHTDTYVYVGFGHSSSGIEKDFWRYDTDANSWTRLNDFPGEARVAGSQFSYNGRGYIIGGDGSDHSNLDTGEFFEYDETNDDWKELPPAPGQGRWAAGSFVIGDNVYYTSGETGFGTLHNDLWTFDLKFTVSTPEISSQPSLVSVFPNPAQDQIQIQGLQSNEEIRNLRILDLNGKEVSGWSLNNDILQVSNLSPQLYLLLIQTSNNELHQIRIVKN